MADDLDAEGPDPWMRTAAAALVVDRDCAAAVAAALTFPEELTLDLNEAEPVAIRGATPKELPDAADLEDAAPVP